MIGSNVVVGALFIAAMPCIAQSPRVLGVVYDSTARVPLAGAVVSLLDSSGATLSRITADGSGRFSLARPPLAAQVRAIRIGYRPRIVRLSLSTHDTTVVIALDHVPPMLSAMRVSDRALCPGSSDRGIAYQLWEQVRAGLLAASVARQTIVASVRTLTFRRQLSPNGDRVRDDGQELRNGQTTKPFVAAADAATLARTGFMTEDSTGRVFFGLDEDVLLDDSFAATHCFRLHDADRAHDGQIGLAFDAAPGRDTLVEVNGVIWLNAAPLALRSLEFAFTGLEPAAMRARPGGRVAFQTASNGIPVATSWLLRMPVLARSVGTSPILQPRMARGRRGRVDVRLSEIRETGGELLDATWPDGTRLRAAVGGISGQVSQNGNDSRAVAVRLRADSLEADRGVATDERRLKPVLPPPDPIAPTSAGSTRTVRGVVADSGGRPVRDVRISARGHGVVSTDDLGRFHFQLPARSALVLDLRRLGFMPVQYSLAAGADTAVVITMLPAVQALATVNITDRRASSARLHGYEQRLNARRSATTGQFFITADEIERRGPDLTSSLFGDIPGMRIVRISVSEYSVAGLKRATGEACSPTVYLDGHRLPDGNINAVVQPQDIAGIEVYPSANGAPAEYQSLNGGCAVILVWRKGE